MQNYNILVVDDEKNILKIVSATLKKEGYEVETAQSSEEAIEKFGQGGYHLVITDLKLPGKTGIELMEYIKSRDADIPVVVVTAFGSIENAVDAIILDSTLKLLARHIEPLRRQPKPARL